MMTSQGSKFVVVLGREPSQASHLNFMQLFAQRSSFMLAGQVNTIRQEHTSLIGRSRY